MNGFELAKQIRQRSQTPLIMLTVRSEEEDVIRALGLGADDFLTKPFSTRILIARIRALLRRVGMETEGTISFDKLILHVEDLSLEGLGEQPISLTPLEVRFLQLLFAHGGRTVSTERILSHVWGNRAGGNRQLLKQLVYRLRQKLETDPTEPRLLKTVPHSGYLIDRDGIPA